MAYTDYIDTLQKAYIAYFGRPADPAGLKYWAELADQQGNADAAIDSFSASAESKALYGDVTPKSPRADIEAMVEKVYQNVLGRASDEGGLKYWVDSYIEGKFSAAMVGYAIVDAALNNDDSASDKGLMTNKLAAAKSFTTAIDPEMDGTPAYTYAGSDDASTARTWLAKVTDDAATVPSAAVVAATLEADFPLEVEYAEIKKFTKEDDKFVGTAADEKFTATSETLSTDDRVTDVSISDNDMLEATLDSKLDSLDTTNIENININWDGYSKAELNFNGTSGVKKYTVTSEKEGYLGNAKIENIEDATLLLGKGVSGKVEIETIEDATVTATVAKELAITKADGALTVNADAATTIAIDGGDEIVLSALAATDVKIGETAVPKTAEVTFGKDANLTINAALNANTAEYTLKAAKDLTVDVATGADFESITVAGDNALTLKFNAIADLHQKEIIDGKTVEIGANLAAGVANDFSKVAADKIVIDGIADGGGATAVKLVSGANVSAKQGLINNAIFDVAKDTDSDSMSLSVKTGQTGKLDFVTGDTGDFETVNLTVAGADVKKDEADVTFAEIDAGEGKVVLTSETNDVTVTKATAKTFDASAVKADLEVTQSAAAEMTVIGGSADNTVTFKGDVVDKDSSFVGQDGDDEVTFATTTGAASAVVKGGDNTVTASSIGAGELSVIAGDGADTLVAQTGGAGAIFANLGAGKNVAKIAAVAADSSVTINSGNGDDSVDLDDSAVAGTVVLNLGDGKNSVSLDAGDNADVTVNTGSGDDTITLKAVSLASDNEATVDLNLGIGNNTVVATVDALKSSAKLSIDGMDNLVVDNDDTPTNVAAAFLNGKTVAISHSGPAFAGGDAAAIIADAKADIVKVDLKDDGGTYDFANVSVSGGFEDGFAGLGIDIEGGDKVDNITGTAQSDFIDAGKGKDVINAGAGNDQVTLKGEDTVDGGAGTDTMIIGEAGAVTVDLSKDDQLTKVGTDANATVQKGFENVTGGAGDDTITGSDAANVIDGGAGADTITGGKGDDTLDGGEGEDTFVFAATAADNGNDEITVTKSTDNVGDIFDFTAFLGGEALGGADGGALSGNEDQAVADKTVYLNKTVDVQNKDFGGADFAEVFAGSGKVINTTVGGAVKAVLIMQDNDGTGDAQIYFIDSAADGTAGDITAADVTLVGTITNVDNSTTFAAEDFA